MPDAPSDVADQRTSTTRYGLTGDGQIVPAMTVQQAAIRLGVSRWTIYRAIADGTLTTIPERRQPGTRGRPTTLISETALDEYRTTVAVGGQSPNEAWIPFSQIAAWTGLSVDLLNRAARQRRFDHIAIGRKYVRRFMTPEQWAKFERQHVITADQPAEPVDADLEAERARARRAPARRRTAA